VDSHAVGGKTEAVAADHRPMVEDNPFADGAALGHGHIGVDEGVVADDGVAADHRAGTNGHPFAQGHPVAEADQGTDGHLRGDGTFFPDHSGRMDALGAKGFAQEEGVDPGGSQRGLIGDDGR
jgi:hypothetical protein